MALSREKKVESLETIDSLLATSKLTVMAIYSGTTVKSMQELRAQAKKDGTEIKVFKNRLFKKALAKNPSFQGVDTSSVNGQLLYAFNSHDEVAPAQVLANFAKTNTQIGFVGALSQNGSFLTKEDVEFLAALPSRDQLRAQLVGTISAPISGFLNVTAGNIRSVLNVFQSRADSL